MKDIGKLISAFAITVSLTVLNSENAWSQNVEIKKFITQGSALKIDDVYYRMNAASQAAIGAFGIVTGKGLRIGKSRFQRTGYIKSIVSYSGRAVALERRTWRRLVGKGELNFGTVKSKIDANYKQEKEIVGSFAVISINQPDVLVRKMFEMARAGSDDFAIALNGRMKNKHFRVIESVVIASDYSSNSGQSVTFNGKTKIAGDTPVSVTADMGSNGKVELDGKQVIAYRYLKLCWNAQREPFPHPDNPGYDGRCPR
ncbi:MAG: hypothetical protein AAF468_20675 [Pseudomonadota bacterium]